MPPKPRPHGKRRRRRPPRAARTGKLCSRCSARQGSPSGRGRRHRRGRRVRRAAARTRRGARAGRLHALEKPALAASTRSRRRRDVADWNTDPPTSGAALRDPGSLGRYTEPAEHGAARPQPRARRHRIQYGPQVPASTVAQLRAFSRPHPRHDPRAVPVPRRQDRARRLDDRGRDGPRRTAPRTSRSARRSTRPRSSRSSTQLPVPGARALPGRHALTRSS